MNNLLSLPFLVAALIEAGLAITVLRLFRYQTFDSPNFVLQRRYWTYSLGAGVFAHSFFVFGIQVPYDAFDTNVFLYLANVGLVVSAILQAWFCLCLTKRFSSFWKIGLLVAFALFAIVFYQFRLTGNFAERSYVVGSMLCLTYTLQLRELWRFKKEKESKLLQLLAIVNLVELVITLARMYAIYSSSQEGGIFLNSLPRVILILTSFQIAFAVLSHIVGSGYWVERTSAQNARIAKENKAIVELLEEKNDLIYSLISTRKIAESGALAATIAHEINQPLAAVQLNAQYLKSILDKNPQQDQLISRVVKHIEEDNKRAAEIVKTLRALFKSADRQLSEISIDLIINNLGSIFMPRARDLKVDFQLDLQAPIPLPINEGEIQQVLMNLINNALDVLEKAEQAHKEIRITSKQDERKVTLRIEDNGPGVPINQREQIFDLMKSNKVDGMGVGLWLSKYIVEHHQGTIECKAGNDHGAVFEIVLPISPIDPQTHQDAIEKYISQSQSPNLG